MAEKPQQDSRPEGASKAASIGDKFKKFQQKLEKEPMPAMFNRPELQNRATAALIDVVGSIIAFIFVAILGRLMFSEGTAALAQGGTGILAGLFLLLKDGFGGRSPGKRLVGLKVVRTEGSGAVDPVTSAMRNWPLALLFAGPVVGTLLGDTGLAAVLAGTLAVLTLALIGYEIYRVLTDREAGIRLGDSVARTRVVED